MSRRLLAVAPVDHPGGAETTLLRLLGGLQARGWAITLATYLNSAVYGRALPAFAATRSLDGLRPRRARDDGRSGAHIVLHIHDMVRRVPPFWRWADRVLAASQAVADRIPDLTPHVVCGPVDADPPAEPSPWPTGKGPVIGLIGRLEPRKGPLDLVNAAAAIRAEAPGRGW